MTSTLTLDSSLSVKMTGTNTGNVWTLFLVQFLVLSGTAYVMTFAANWANRNGHPAIRFAILILSWIFVAILGAAPFLTIFMQLMGRPIPAIIWLSVGTNMLTAAVWIWMLLTKVDKPVKVE